MPMQLRVPSEKGRKLLPGAATLPLLPARAPGMYGQLPSCLQVLAVVKSVVVLVVSVGPFTFSVLLLLLVVCATMSGSVPWVELSMLAPAPDQRLGS